MARNRWWERLLGALPQQCLNHPLQRLQVALDRRRVALDGLAAYLRERQRVRPARKVVSYKPRKPAVLKRAA